MQMDTIPEKASDETRKPHSWEAMDPSEPRLYQPGAKAAGKDTQHVFHSGWMASQGDAFDNANQLRDDMSQRGMQTSPQQWSVYSDPQEWKVFRDKSSSLNLDNAAEQVPTAMHAAGQMARNTVGHTPTVWHGHSQGGSQLSATTELATQMLATDKDRRAKAGGYADELYHKTHPGEDGHADEASLARFHQLMGKQNVNEQGKTFRMEEVPHVSMEGDVSYTERQVWDVDVSEKEQKRLLGDQIAREKAEKKINKYNMFSYSGAASYPQEYVGNANFTHNHLDPVSSAAVSATSGPSWVEGDGRRSQSINVSGSLNPHGYGHNYALNDARVTKDILQRAQLPTNTVAAGADQKLSPGNVLDGLSVNDGGGVINTGISGATSLVNGGKAVANGAYNGGKAVVNGAYNGGKAVVNGAYNGGKAVVNGAYNGGAAVLGGVYNGGKALVNGISNAMTMVPDLGPLDDGDLPW